MDDEEFGEDNVQYEEIPDPVLMGLPTPENMANNPNSQVPATTDAIIQVYQQALTEALNQVLDMKTKTSNYEPGTIDYDPTTGEEYRGYEGTYHPPYPVDSKGKLNKNKIYNNYATIFGQMNELLQESGYKTMSFKDFDKVLNKPNDLTDIGSKWFGFPLFRKEAFIKELFDDFDGAFKSAGISPAELIDWIASITFAKADSTFDRVRSNSYKALKRYALDPEERIPDNILQDINDAVIPDRADEAVVSPEIFEEVVAHSSDTPASIPITYANKESFLYDVSRDLYDSVLLNKPFDITKERSRLYRVLDNIRIGKDESLGLQTIPDISAAQKLFKSKGIDKADLGKFVSNADARPLKEDFIRRITDTSLNNLTPKTPSKTGVTGTKPKPSTAMVPATTQSKPLTLQQKIDQRIAEIEAQKQQDIENIIINAETKSNIPYTKKQVRQKVGDFISQLNKETPQRVKIMKNKIASIKAKKQENINKLVAAKMKKEEKISKTVAKRKPTRTYARKTTTDAKKRALLDKRTKIEAIKKLQALHKKNQGY